MKTKDIEQLKVSGQTIIVSLLLFFVALVVVSTLLGPIVLFISFGINATNGTVNAQLIETLLNFIPVFMVLVLIISLFLIIQTR